MECIGTCRLCGAKVTYNVDNIIALGEHLIKKHPEIDITHYTLEDSGHTRRLRDKSPHSSAGLSRRISSAASSFVRKSSTYIKDKRSKSSEKKRRVYKTTVESWHPGSDPITCPKCGSTDQPYIRKQRNKVAYNSVGAYFLLGCWPLCFLPMIMFGGTTTTVCCRKCGYCFGTYDNKQGKLVPMDKDTTIETPNIC